MKHFVAIFLAVATAVLVGWGWIDSASAAGVSLRSNSTPEMAVQDVLHKVQARDWDGAYQLLGNRDKLDRAAFIADVAGSEGSLRTYSSLQDSDVTLLHKTANEATARVKMNWSTAVGSISDTRDVQLVRDGDKWQVMWPVSKLPQLPAQVVPVTYLRWDIINRGPEGDWGTSSIDSPKARIISMNAVEQGDRVIVMGEVVNEDSIPAYINVNATLVGTNGGDLAEESSFDKIAHILLPSQVTPYRVDFPHTKLSDVKQVRMDLKSGPTVASADPVIGVLNQHLENNPLGGKILRGELDDQSGQPVNIAHVLATCYDNNGKVIWVTDSYVQRALLPSTPQPFAVSLPDDVASRAQSFRVMVTHYSMGNS